MKKVKEILKPVLLDWSKEKTVDANYCGWCTNTHTGGSCTGDCFVRKDYEPKLRRQYKLAHVEDELKRMKQLKKDVALRKMWLEKERLRLKNDV